LSYAADQGPPMTRVHTRVFEPGCASKSTLSFLQKQSHHARVLADQLELLLRGRLLRNSVVPGNLREALHDLLALLYGILPRSPTAT